MRPLPALLTAVAALALPRGASAQGWAERTGIYLRSGFAVSAMDPAALTFAANSSPTAARTGLPSTFTGKYLGWSRGVFAGGSIGAAVDARWFYVRIGADLFAAPAVTTQPSRFHADVLSLAWAAAGPRYAWRQFAAHLGARFGAAVMALRSENGRVEYTGVTGTYAAELGVQWRPLRWLELDASVAQDFAALGATTITLAVNLGWSRPR